MNGVQYKGDGYTWCEAIGPGRCMINNGGCWSEIIDGQKFSACSMFDEGGCRCPHGFRGDGWTCEEVHPFTERNASKFGWFVTFLVLGIVSAAGIAGYVFYKYRLRSYMDSEILSIMSQYMPLDGQQNNQVVHHEAEPLQQGSAV